MIQVYRQGARSERIPIEQYYISHDNYMGMWFTIEEYKDKGNPYDIHYQFTGACTASGYAEKGATELIFYPPEGCRDIRFAAFIDGGTTTVPSFLPEANNVYGECFYKPYETEDYLSHNGDMTLFPTEATVHAVLNGTWEAELEHPVDEEGRWKYLEEEAVVKMPSFFGEDDQLFRIKKTKKSDSGISCTMEPIFYDSIGDCFLEDVRPTKKNGQQALDLMLAPNSKYSGSSDITRTATASLGRGDPF